MRLRRNRRSRSNAAASCREVARVLQEYLDGQGDEVSAQRVRAHLEACRDCGMEATVFEELISALARRAPDLDAGAVERVRQFSQELLDDGPGLPETAG